GLAILSPNPPTSSRRTPPPPPAEDLLLCCARPQRDARHADRVAVVVHAGLDWERVLALARSHGLMPLLHRHLSLQADGLSQPVAARLCAEARAAARRNLDLTGGLLSLLQLLAGHDLPVLPLK